MFKVLAYLFLAVLLFIPVVSYAENNEKPVPKDEKIDDGLAKTQKRLDALINAAIAHDIVNAEKKKPKASKSQVKDSHTKAHPPKQHKDQAAKIENVCVENEIFEFPQQVFVADYQSLIMLKNKILIGPNEIDNHQVRLLVLAYIGLGFGEEAQDFSEYLDGVEKQVLVAMGRSVTGGAQATDVRVLTSQNNCSSKASLWSSFAKIQRSDSDLTSSADAKIVLSSEQLAQIEALPKNLKAIMAKSFGINAVKHDAMNTASVLLQSLINAQGGDTQGLGLDDESRFFQAQFYLHKQDAKAYPILKALAKENGPMQVQALQELGVIQMQTGAIAYPEFVADLDSAAHVFAQHPEGKRALIEKINYFVAADKIDQAIGMTKEKFSIEEEFYASSVLRVSERMRLHLTGDNEKQKLHALNTLLREQIFFDALADGFPLRRDGISASLDLDLSELAPRILPVTQWGRLDLHILQELAVSLPEDMKSNLPKKAFSGSAFEAQKIEIAFNKKQPKLAMNLLRGVSDNEEAIKVAARKSWENGYWPLAKETQVTLSKMQTPNGPTNNASIDGKIKLASALSVPLPYLKGGGNSLKSIDDYRALRTFLDGDIKIIKDYVNHE